MNNLLKNVSLFLVAVSLAVTVYEVVQIVKEAKEEAK